jgi:cytochrome P450
MVCDLLGIPADLAPEVLAAVNAGSLAQPGEGVDTAQARPNYLEYLTPVVERRRADPAGDPLPVVDGLLGYRLPDGSALDDVEVATQMLCIFIGGTETVPKIAAHGLWQLSQRPGQLAAVRADPEKTVPVAREEMIRFCAPAQWFARTARKPFTIHDRTIRPGQRIITLLASANRDEREYPEPDEFVWNRPIRRSLAFGRGQHFCIGYHLARLEIAVLVQEWLRRVPDYAIVSDAATRLPSSFQWGWNTIPVEV